MLEIRGQFNTAICYCNEIEESARQQLAGQYRACYPYNTQLPVQQEAEKLLQGGNAQTFWQRLFGK